MFENNKANIRGGAIYYNLQRPYLLGNTFINNSAQYGPNIGSYPVRIVLTDDHSDSIILNDVASGIQHSDKLVLSLVDFDNQTMVLDSESTLKISPVTNNASISGTDYAKVNKGVATFEGVTFITQAGTQNVIYKMTSKSVATDFIMDISFRF